MLSFLQVLNLNLSKNKGVVFMEKNKEFLRVRDIFRECADIMDKVIELEKREEKGEDVTPETERLMGRYMMLLMELNSLTNN